MVVALNVVYCAGKYEEQRSMREMAPEKRDLAPNLSNFQKPGSDPNAVKLRRFACKREGELLTFSLYAFRRSPSVYVLTPAARFRAACAALALGVD